MRGSNVDLLHVLFGTVLALDDATLLLITVVTQWNNFLWPSIIAPASEWSVLTVATSALQTQFDGNWTLVMAATTVAMAPLLVLFAIFQRSIVSSISLTGFK